MPTPVPIPAVPRIPSIPPAPPAEPDPGAAPRTAILSDPKTSTELAGELVSANAEQELLAQQLAEQRRQVEQLAAIQNELQGQIAQTASALDAITADLRAVRAQIAATVQRITNVKAAYDQLVAALGRLDSQLADLVRRESEKQLELRGREALLADGIRAAYDADRTSLLEALVSGRPFTDFLAEVAYHLDVAQQDRTLAERIRLDQETLRTLRESVELTRDQTNLVRQETAVQKRELDAELARLEATTARLAELEAQTEGDLEMRKRAYEELARTTDDLEGTIARAQVAQSSLAAEISTLISTQAALGYLPSVYNGTFAWPLVARVSQEWGCSAYPGYAPGGPGCANYHNGIDIAGSCNKDIAAAGDGTVAYVGWNWADGPDPAWIVVIAHSTSLKTWYAHMQPSPPPGIAPGARVAAGDVIGYVGSTGRSSGCHLHWMIEHYGQFVNPRLFL